MILNDIDLNKLKVFHSVMHRGSYKAASEELNLTRSAISQAITSLESQLGFSLFLRKSKKLIPTDRAYNIFNEFDKYQNSLEQILSKSKTNYKDVSGTIRIGAYSEFTKNRLFPVLEKFIKTHPVAQVRFHFASPSNLAKLLEENKIDMSFSIYPVKGVKSIESKKLIKEELLLIAPKNLYSPKMTYQELIKLPVIDYYSNHKLIERWIFFHYNKRPKNLPIRIYAASADMLLASVQQGLGIGVIPGYMLNSENMDAIQVIRPSHKVLTDFIWLNQYKNQFENSAHKAFYQNALEYFNIS